MAASGGVSPSAQPGPQCPPGKRGGGTVCAACVLAPVGGQLGEQLGGQPRGPQRQARQQARQQVAGARPLPGGRRRSDWPSLGRRRLGLAPPGQLDAGAPRAGLRGPRRVRCTEGCESVRELMWARALHNDVHSHNVFVRELDTPVNLKFEVDGQMLRLYDVRYVLKLYDWDWAGQHIPVHVRPARLGPSRAQFQADCIRNEPAYPRRNPQGDHLGYSPPGANGRRSVRGPSQDGGHPTRVTPRGGKLQRVHRVAPVTSSSARVGHWRAARAPRGTRHQLVGARGPLACRAHWSCPVPSEGSRAPTLRACRASTVTAAGGRLEHTRPAVPR